jgi:hypothetical protein
MILMNNHILEKYKKINDGDFDFDDNEINIDLNTIKPDYLYTRKDNIFGIGRIYISDNLIIGDPNIYNNYSDAFINIEKIINNERVREITESIDCGFNFAVENVMTNNLILYYDYEINNKIVLHDDIPNFY